MESKLKNIVAGLGEIGIPILKVVSKDGISIGYDIDPKLMNLKLFEKYTGYDVKFLHICIPFTTNFEKNVKNLILKFNPEIVVIHSTVKPNTTENIQKSVKSSMIYSATRGVHKRMLSDMKRYVKFFGLPKNTPNRKKSAMAYSKMLKKCGIKSKEMTNSLTLELAKIVCDTSYYGWLITYSQISNMIAMKNGVDYDEMWSFTDEIHKFLGNRPKMFPGFIGGHCVIPNLKLIDHEILNMINEINNKYSKLL